MSLIHIGISVSDLDRTIIWYEDIFSLKVTKTFEKKEFEIKGAVLTDGKLTIEALAPYYIQKCSDRPANLVDALKKQGLNHIALEVDDVKALYDKLKSRNETVVTDLIEGRFFFCTDPDGTLMEIKQK